ncbi:hypothetical protein D9M69_658340 [compost metagenome]
MVILLLGIPEELAARVRATGRADYTTDKLRRDQDTMCQIYAGQPGVVIIDAKFLTIPEVTKRVAQVIHRGAYVPADLMGIMRSHAEKKDATTQS